MLKNVRNQFLDRNFEIEGNEISAKYIKMIYELQQKELAKPVRQLTKKHVNQNSLEKQKVKPAMDIFRKETTAALRMHRELQTEGFENVEPTVQFMEVIHKWISVHDVSSTKEHILKRFPDKKPFYSSTDERLAFIEVTFVNKLQEWKRNVDELVRKIPTDQKEKIKFKKRKFLTKETHHARLLHFQLVYAFGTCLKR